MGQHGPRWKFEDPFLSEEYEFEVNPAEGGSPEFSKTISYQATSAWDGQTLVFEGRDQVKNINFSGKILTQDQLDVMTAWFEKRRSIKVTDDLGRTNWIYITKFTPKRERAVHHPWKHSYQLESVILDRP